MRFEGRPHSGLVVGDDREESQHGAVTPLPPGPVGPRCSLQLLFLFAAARLAPGGSCLDSMGSPHAVPHSLSVPSSPDRSRSAGVQCPTPSTHRGWRTPTVRSVCCEGLWTGRSPQIISAGDSWCTGGRVGRQGRWGVWQALNLKG